MSQWTHVSGMIRVDNLPDLTNLTEESLAARIGNTCSYNDDDATWKKCTVPCGSEGSVQYKIDIVGDGFVWANVSIWADLRDFGSPEPIYQWIRKACIGLMIRSCVVLVDIESGGRYLIIDDYVEADERIKMIPVVF